jgi:hypothetical protein
MTVIVNGSGIVDAGSQAMTLFVGVTYGTALLMVAVGEDELVADLSGHSRMGLLSSKFDFIGE